MDFHSLNFLNQVQGELLTADCRICDAEKHDHYILRLHLSNPKKYFEVVRYLMILQYWHKTTHQQRNCFSFPGTDRLEKMYWDLYRGIRSDEALFMGTDFQEESAKTFFRNEQTNPSRMYIEVDECKPYKSYYK